MPSSDQQVQVKTRHIKHGFRRLRGPIAFEPHFSHVLVPRRTLFLNSVRQYCLKIEPKLWTAIGAAACRTWALLQIKTSFEYYGYTPRNVLVNLLFAIFNAPSPLGVRL